VKKIFQSSLKTALLTTLNLHRELLPGTQKIRVWPVHGYRLRHGPRRSAEI